MIVHISLFFLKDPDHTADEMVAALNKVPQ